jgi:hypothetical protein
MKRFILFLIVLAGIVEGCKYEDGPLISLRSAKNRLYGIHTLTKYTVDGLDSLSLYKDSLAIKFSLFYNDVYNLNACDIDGIRNDGKDGSVGFRWTLKNSNKEFCITYSGGVKGTGPIGKNKTSEWQILKLKSNDIKMKTTYNGKEYVIELK